MDDFNGFQQTNDLSTPIPPEFFTSLLPRIEDLYELKLALYLFWVFGNTENEFPCFTAAQLALDPIFLSGFGASHPDQLSRLHKSIQHALKDKILLTTTDLEDSQPQVFFLNTPEGRNGLELVRNGTLKIESINDSLVKLTKARPNVFKLYEDNIGIITPLVAETLSELEETYPPEWIKEAFVEAVKNNVRKLRYIEVILKNWQEEGRYERTDRRRSKKDQEEYDPDRYIDGDYSDFIDH